MRRSQRGFTLIELLIVVGVIGVIATIAVPALISAIQRAKQKRSMADIRGIATAIESYAVDLNAVPEQSGGGDVEDIQSIIQPTYIKSVPLRDGWATAFYYETDSTGNSYTLTSYGKDGASSGPTSGPTTSFEDDIIFSSGSYIAWPEGTQD